jgi:hypothetical protein
MLHDIIFKELQKYFNIDLCYVLTPMIYRYKINNYEKLKKLKESYNNGFLSIDEIHNSINIESFSIDLNGLNLYANFENEVSLITIHTKLTITIFNIVLNQD